MKGIISCDPFETSNSNKVSLAVAQCSTKDMNENKVFDILFKANFILSNGLGSF